MNQPEHNDPVWKLLAHTRRAEPGPYFTRRVMREVGVLSEVSSETWLKRLASASFPRLAIPSVVAMAAVALFIVFQTESVEPEGGIVDPGLVLQIGENDIAPEVEMEAVEYLGQLMAVADPDQLSDDALADLFF